MDRSCRLSAALAASRCAALRNGRRTAPRRWPARGQHAARAQLLSSRFITEGDLLPGVICVARPRLERCTLYLHAATAASWRLGRQQRDAAQSSQRAAWSARRSACGHAAGQATRPPLGRRGNLDRAAARDHHIPRRSEVACSDRRAPHAHRHPSRRGAGASTEGGPSAADPLRALGEAACAANRGPCPVATGAAASEPPPHCLDELGVGGLRVGDENSLRVHHRRHLAQPGRAHRSAGFHQVHDAVCEAQPARRLD